MSDQPGHAQLTDPNLVNAWGLASGPTTPIWAANNHTSTATIYSGAVHGAPAAIVPLVVSVQGGDPTGQVFNGSDSFQIKVNGSWTPAVFLFDSESGHITAWAPGNPTPTVAQIKASVSGAVYKGLDDRARRRAAVRCCWPTDFARSRIDVFNGQFQRSVLPRRRRSHDPTAAASGCAPFNVQDDRQRRVPTSPYAKARHHGPRRWHRGRTGAGLGLRRRATTGSGGFRVRRVGDAAAR